MPQTTSTEPNQGVTPLLALLEQQQTAFYTEGTPSRAQRTKWLVKLSEMVGHYEAEIVAACNEDYSCHAFQEARMTECLMPRLAARHARRHVGRWMRRRRVPTSILYMPGYSRIIPQPKGVVGIVSAWNYPFHQCFMPAVGALAAGNRIMLKPSELAPACAELIRKMVEDYFPPDVMTVVIGDQGVSSQFAALPFDHLLFTGSPRVGRMIASAAAPNLTPVTLELGGKSPSIVDESASLSMAAEKIVYGKLFNGGQTCIAPDYVLVPKALREKFVHEAVSAARRMYPNLLGDPSYTAIINEKQEKRLRDLLEEAKATGAEIVDSHPEVMPTPNSRQMQFSLVLDPPETLRLMNEEIFGPILPVIGYTDIDEAIAYVNARPRPLSLYWYGSKMRRCDEILRRTWAGGVTINDVILHGALDDLPFGGVGESGYGAYHGAVGFDTFSHLKPVFYQPRVNAINLIRPPYGRVFDTMYRMIDRMMT